MPNSQQNRRNWQHLSPLVASHVLVSRGRRSELACYRDIPTCDLCGCIFADLALNECDYVFAIVGERAPNPRVLAPMT